MKATGSLLILALCALAGVCGAQDTPRPKILGVAHIAVYAADFKIVVTRDTPPASP